jgi:hypothetical protein
MSSSSFDVKYRYTKPYSFIFCLKFIRAIEYLYFSYLGQGLLDFDLDRASLKSLSVIIWHLGESFLFLESIRSKDLLVYDSRDFRGLKTCWFFSWSRAPFFAIINFVSFFLTDFYKFCSTFLWFKCLFNYISYTYDLLCR